MRVQMSRGAISIVIGTLLFSAGGYSAESVPGTPEGVFSGATFSRSSLSTVWKLEEAELERYQMLEIEERVYSDPSTVQSPYAVLGKNARTDEERAKYARLEQQKMDEHTIKAIVWVLAVQEQAGYNDISPVAANAKKALEIYDAVPALQDAFAREGIERERFVSALQESYGMSAHDDVASNMKSRVVFFVPLDKCGENSVCLDMLQTLQSQQVVGNLDMIDVVVMDKDGHPPTDRQIVEWANKYQVVNKQTINKRVTLQAINADSEVLLGDREAPLSVLLDGTVYQ